MRRLHWLLLLLAVSASAASFAADIQVSCEPGVRVYLDGKPVGTSSAKDDGLFLPNVRGGTHVVRVEKDGFVPQEFKVAVEKLPVEVKVAAFVPLPPDRAASEPAAPEVNEATGGILITSAPQKCTVELDGKSQDKTLPVLRLEGLAVGDHAIAFSKEGYARLAGVVKVFPGGTITVRGDLQTGTLENISEGKGSLRVYSSPEFCKIFILGKTRDKAASVFNLSYLPAGEHHMVVTWRNQQLSTDVLISDHRRTVVTVSFMQKETPFVVTYEPE
jgi:hypothetical protein